MTQLDLLSTTTSAPSKPARPTLEQRFQLFHKENPHVFARMLELARARLDRGERWISVKALWEELRASLAKRELAYDADYEPEFKLNNNHTAFYARVLVETEPRLIGVIETRRRKSK